MTIASNTSITLDVHSPKKAAVVATGAPTVGANDVAVYATAAVDGALTNSILGDFEKLLRYALSTLGTHTDAVALEIPLGGGDSQIQTAVPTDGTVCFYIGADIINKQQSHFIDRTFKRLREAWLEESK